MAKCNLKQTRAKILDQLYFKLKSISFEKVVKENQRLIVHDLLTSKD